jgi:hypothetical protein
MASPSEEREVQAAGTSAPQAQPSAWHTGLLSEECMMNTGQVGSNLPGRLVGTSFQVLEKNKGFLKRTSLLKMKKSLLSLKKRKGMKGMFFGYKQKS